MKTINIPLVYIYDDDFPSKLHVPSQTQGGTIHSQKRSFPLRCSRVSTSISQIEFPAQRREGVAGNVHLKWCPRFCKRKYLRASIILNPYVAAESDIFRNKYLDGTRSPWRWCLEASKYSQHPTANSSEVLDNVYLTGTLVFFWGGGGANLDPCLTINVVGDRRTNGL